MCPVQPNHRKIVSYNSFPPPPPYPSAYDWYQGHGTHVSGIVAGAAGPNYILATQYNGSAPGAKIVFDDISNTEPYLNYLPWDLNNSLYPHAYGNGARIHSNSWGRKYSRSYDFQCVETDSFMYDHDDFLVVFAAGNSGPYPFSIGSPGVAKNVLSVGSSLNSQYKHTDLSIFSSRGPTFDLRNKPDIIAPGQNIFSASSDGIRNSYQCANSIGLNKSCILEMSGTSMATPAVAGAAAIVRQYFEQGYQVSGERSDDKSANPSSALVKAMIIQSSKPLRSFGSDMSWQESTESPSPEQGYGLLDLSSVLWFGPDSNFVLKTYDRVELYTALLCYIWRNQFRATLVWTDPPGSMYASKSLISDLDLFVVDVNGSTHYGNHRT
ncbi:hypothetical protein GUITHDRAFT_76253, partial [Guillardia theta CCMP2712]